jgi:DNA transposition AAA+ family ATPase
MNNADNFPVDVDELRRWALQEKADCNHSWPEFGKLAGIAHQTLSLFCTGKYAGNNENVARQLFRYKQTRQSQAQRAMRVPHQLGYFETRTSRRITGLLVIAHMGRITVVGTSPGTGKTITIEEYRASVSNCWIVTIRPATKTLASMIHQVIQAIGGQSAGVGWTRLLSDRVIDMVKGRNGLLIIDEANNLEMEAIEEIRAWHDKTGVGICLLGNEELIERIRAGRHRDAYARLNSRIAQSHTQTLPHEEDVATFLDHWGIEDSKSRKLLTRIALTPGTGGLREIRQIIESASFLADDDGQELSLDYLQEAQSARSTRWIRTGTNG